MYILQDRRGHERTGQVKTCIYEIRSVCICRCICTMLCYAMQFYLPPTLLIPLVPLLIVVVVIVVVVVVVVVTVSPVPAASSSWLPPCRSRLPIPCAALPFPCRCRLPARG